MESAPNLSSTFTIDDLPANPEPFQLINKIPIHDNGEPLVDLRVTNPNLAIAEKCVPLVREGIAEKLHLAISHLPRGYNLKINTGLRTLKMQSDMYWKNFEKLKDEHPTWPLSALRRQCNRFFAPPDTLAPPGHCTGAAVDVELLDTEGNLCEMSAPLDRWQAAPTICKRLGEAAKANRLILAFSMHSAGFSNCRDEWWHWSYGDSAWAVRAHEKVAIYGLIEPPNSYVFPADSPADEAPSELPDE